VVSLKPDRTTVHSIHSVEMPWTDCTVHRPCLF